MVLAVLVVVVVLAAAVGLICVMQSGSEGVHAFGVVWVRWAVCCHYGACYLFFCALDLIHLLLVFNGAE